VAGAITGQPLAGLQDHERRVLGPERAQYERSDPRKEAGHLVRGKGRGRPPQLADVGGVGVTRPMDDEPGPLVASASVDEARR